MLSNIKKYIKNRLGIMIGLIAFGSYSFGDVVSKYSIGVKQLDIMPYFFYINLFSLVILTFYCLAINRKSFINIPLNKIKFVAIKAILLVMSFVLSVVSLARLPLDIFYPIVFFMPSVAMFLGHFILKERVTRINIAVGIMGFCGILIVTQPWNALNFSSDYIIGMLASISLTLTTAVTMIFSRRYLKDINPYAVTWYALLLMTMVFFAFTRATPDINLLDINTEYLVYAFFGAIFVSAGLLFSLVAIVIGPVSGVTLAQYSQMVWGIVLGFVIFSDIPTSMSIIGCLVIITSNIINMILAPSKQ